MPINPKINAGDTVTWTDLPKQAADGNAISAATHDMSYSIRGQSSGQIDVAGVVTGANWVFTITNSQSAALNATPAPLLWYWQAYATNRANGARISLFEGQLTVKPNLATISSGYDGRSQAEKDLAAVKAEISNRISNSGAVIKYTIGTRSLEKEPIAELLKLESRLAMQVAREQHANALANGLGNNRKQMVRFV